MFNKRYGTKGLVGKSTESNFKKLFNKYNAAKMKTGPLLLDTRFYLEDIWRKVAT